MLPCLRHQVYDQTTGTVSRCISFLPASFILPRNLPFASQKLLPMLIIIQISSSFILMVLEESKGAVGDLRNQPRRISKSSYLLLISTVRPTITKESILPKSRTAFNPLSWVQIPEFHDCSNFPGHGTDYNTYVLHRVTPNINPAENRVAIPTTDFLNSASSSGPYHYTTALNTLS